MTKNEIIFEILKSLNNGNSGPTDTRIALAVSQYEELKEKGLLEGIITDENLSHQFK